MHKGSSLADKVIRNSFYQVMLQFFTFLFPVILTPLIISKIGEEQFGIYALVLGFVTVFGLFDLSLSSSFVVFISKHYESRNYEKLNSYFNTGLFFYIVTSLIICIAGYILRDPIISFLNIPERFSNVAATVYILGLAIFFLSSVFTVFSSVLISIQKMYVTGAAGITGAFVNFALTLSAIYAGYGLSGIIMSQLITVLLVSFINTFAALRSVPELRINPSDMTASAVKEMAKFGSQMQVSKLAGFASEKFDEFLLAHFTTLSNVTFFNVASRVSRTGRLLPFQIIPQIAPIASGMKAKSEDRKLSKLFEASSKYLSIAAAPVFVYIFAFSELIISTWIGSGYEISSDILKVLAVGQLINLAFSAPGNSVIPNTGEPKYQMHEGLMNLVLNVILSIIFIKYYGIMGAAAGSVIAMSVSSLYVFFRSAGHFGKDVLAMISKTYLLPISASVNAGIITFLAYYLSSHFLFPPEGRTYGLLYLIFTLLLFSSVFLIFLMRSGYLDKNDKILISKAFAKVTPVLKFLKTDHHAGSKYENEKLSFFVVTHNRLGMLKKCLSSLIDTVNGLNYELIVIDNASDDGTEEFLRSLANNNQRIRIVRNQENIGTNAKSQAAELAAGDFIIGIDDDVLDFPAGWAERMVSGYKTIPGMGYLSSDVVMDETTNGAKHPAECYNRETFGDDITLLVGPTGGWCFVLSRDVYLKVGKLLTFSDRIFFSEDGDYVNRIRNMGYRYGILEGVKVYHATGEFHNREYAKVFNEKYADYVKGEPLTYKLLNKLKNLVAFRRYALKIDELSRQSFNWQ